MPVLHDGKHRVTCIRCPRGCTVQAHVQSGTIVDVTGNFCPRGKEYAQTELIHPVRMVTTSVRLKGSKLQRQVPVKTSCEVSKNKVQDVVDALRDIELEIPTHIGDVILSNVCGTHADIIVTKSIDL